MKAENRTYKVTYFDGTKEEIVGTKNLPPQSQVRSIRLVKGKQPPQSAKNNANKLSERQYIVKYHDGTEELITGYHNLPDKSKIASMHRVREEQTNAASNTAPYLCFADFEYTCGGMTGDIPFDAAYGQEILSIGLVIAVRETGEPVDTFYRTVRPDHNQYLTGFCKSLTGLTQQEIDDSDNFETVMKETVAFCKQYDFQEIYAFGNGDKQIMLKDQKRHLPVPGLKSLIDKIHSIDSHLSKQLFQSSLPISLANLKELCRIDGPVQHHALSDAQDLCAVWFCVQNDNYDKAFAQQYQSERINRAEYYRERQFLSLRSPAKLASTEEEKQAQEKAITSAVDVIAYLKELNAAQPFVQDIKLMSFCDDLLALIGAPDECFAVQKSKKE